MMNISSLQHFYKGFAIDDPVGNNAFSFQQRVNKSVHVAPLISGGLNDVKRGERIAFSEIVDEREINERGLQSFVHMSRPDQDVVVFDNHSHAFFFWAAAIEQGVFPVGLPLVHVDQHKDTRVPARWFEALIPETGHKTPDCSYVKKAFEYTDRVLNVGNFIPPALKAGFFSEVVQVATEEAFTQEFEKPFVLDLDLDIFAPVMEYIPNELKVARLRQWVARASFVTVATSPFFIDQDVAIGYLQRILKEI